ncbi:MAG: V-type ATPase subunit [Planctomycetota bacterium]
MELTFDFVNAKIRAMRSMLYEADRLRALSQLRTSGELLAALFPQRRIAGVLDFERALVETHVSELLRVWKCLYGRQADFFFWNLVRYQVEDLKVILRGAAAGEDPKRIRELLVDLPGPLALPLDDMIALRADPAALADRLTGKGVAELLAQRNFPATEDPFLRETALDARYLMRLVDEVKTLSQADQDVVQGLVRFEVDLANVLAALRARLNYGLTPEAASGLYIPAAGRIHREAWLALLADPSLERAARLLGMRPEEVASLSLLEWLGARRLYDLACRRFRRSMLDYGAVPAFFHIKRTELANLLRLSGTLSYELEARTAATGLIGVA